MFIDSLVTLMTADPSINSLATGGIVYEHLPVDFDQSKVWIVFSYQSSGDTFTLTGYRAFSDYQMQVQIIAPGITNVLNISELLNNYLTNYVGNMSLTLSDDDININTEKNVYYKTINYNITNVN